MIRMTTPHPELGIDAQRAESLHTLWATMRSLCVAWRSHVTRMSARYGLSSAQFTVFMAVASGGQLTMGQIGERSALPTSSLTALVDRLVDLGLVQREPYPGDRRAIHVQLTAAGRTLAERVAEETVRDSHQITAELDAGELDDISTSVGRLLTGYQRYVAQATDSGPIDGIATDRVAAR